MFAKRSVTETKLYRVVSAFYIGVGYVSEPVAVERQRNAAHFPASAPDCLRTQRASAA